jgi:hypothetical protein
MAVGYRWVRIVDATEGPAGSAPRSTSDGHLPSDKGTDGIVLAPTMALTGGLGAEVRLPSVPGSYRLVTTIHDGERVALGLGVTSVVPAIVVRVVPSDAHTWLYGEQTGKVDGGSAGLPIELLGGR